MWTPEVRRTGKARTAEQEYLDELKSVACCYGFSPESVDRLLESGFSTDGVVHCKCSRKSPKNLLN